jgi:hypothetical protein
MPVSLKTGMSGLPMRKNTIAARISSKRKRCRTVAGAGGEERRAYCTKRRAGSRGRGGRGGIVGQ